MKGIDTKERIIKKSAELFNLYGYHGCSLSDIMNATELKKGGIYNHFNNKDEIALEAFDYGMEKVIKRFRDRLDLCKTAAEKLFAMIVVMYSFYEDPVIRGGCPIFNTAVDSLDTHPELQAKARDGIATLQRYMELKFEEGIAAGDIKNNTDIESTTSMMISSLEGALIRSRIDGNTKHLDIAKKYTFDLLSRQLV